jgi:hypothetical protein
MNNSENSATTSTQTGTITLTLHLKNYLTPSLNTILSSHWSNLHKHKKKARFALASALKELQQNSKILTILSAEPNLSPINSAKLDSFLMTTQNPSTPDTPNKSAATSKTKKPSSISSIPSHPHQTHNHPHNLINTSSANEVS